MKNKTIRKMIRFPIAILIVPIVSSILWLLEDITFKEAIIDVWEIAMDV